MTVQEHGVRLEQLEEKMAQLDARLAVMRRIEAYLVDKYQIPASVLSGLSPPNAAPPPIPPKVTSGLLHSHFTVPCPPLPPKPGSRMAVIVPPTSAAVCQQPPATTELVAAQPKPMVKSVGRLQSSAINKRVLIPVDAVLAKYQALVRKQGKTGELACKLAREAFFGEEVMVKCTANGYGDRPGLPQAELLQLKEVIRKHSPQYWTSPHEFEMLWCKCLEAISQGCKRLRCKNNHVL